MSVCYSQPMTPESIEIMKKAFGEPVKMDTTTALYDRITHISSETGRHLANATGGPVTFELHGEGDIKEVAGTKYRVTKDGWRKI